MILAWTNTLLISKGYAALPVISEEEVALIVTLVISLWAWFKNNYVTKKGKAQKEALVQKGLA